MIRLLPILCLLLSGCAVVSVQSDGGKPSLSVWPMGVRVERGRADAVSVRSVTVGLASGCRMVGAGVIAERCTVIDPMGCPVAVTSSASPGERKALGAMAARLSGTCPRAFETRVAVLPGGQLPQPQSTARKLQVDGDPSGNFTSSAFELRGEMQ